MKKDDSNAGGAPMEPIDELFEKPLHEAADDHLDVAMFAAPGREVGKADPCLSPLQFFAVTQVERSDVAGVDDAIWLKTEERDTVSDEGIELMGRHFTDDALTPYITKGVPANRRPKLAIRYNAALAARRVLDEVRVYEISPTGSYDEIARCRTREQYLARIDMNDVFRLQAEYLRITAAQRSEMRNRLIAVQGSEVAVERLEQKAAARWRTQGKQKYDAVVSRPIRADDELSFPDDKHASLQEQLRRAEAEAKADPAPTRSAGTRADEKARGSKRKSRASKKDLSAVTTHSQPVSESEIGNVDLGRALGGAAGFHRTPDDEE